MSARFRQRKISVKQKLQVLKQRDIPDLDTEDQQRELQHIETGVEKGEEDEHHLQQVIHASEAKFKGRKVENVYIPTPDASKLWPEASKFYTQRFEQPKTYIKFSATVEDTSGISYNMDEEDDEFLQDFNSKQKSPDSKLTEDDFEYLMDKYEKTCNEKQPFITMDPSQILSFKEMKTYILNPLPTDEDVIRESLAKALKVDEFHTLLEQPGHTTKPLKILIDKVGEKIYTYWKNRRTERGGKPVFPILKFEDKNQKDDNNPYTTFRRREIRQTRKTRRTDVQSIEKLKIFFGSIKGMNNVVMGIVEKEVAKQAIIKQRLELFEKRNKLRIQKRTQPDPTITDDAFALPKKLTLPPFEDVIASYKKKQELKLEEANASSRNKDSNHPNNSNKKQANQKSSNKNNSSNGAINNNGSAQQNNQNNQNNIQQQQQQQKQQQQAIQPYVKLPPAKVPDLDMMTVNGILLEKHENIRRAVTEKLKKRRDGDKGWINFTDDPYNPYFDMSMNEDYPIQQFKHFPGSAIISSLFEVENSRYINFSDNFNLHKFYSPTDNDIVRINAASGELMKNERKTALPEYFDVSGEPLNINEYGIEAEEIVNKFNEKNKLNVSEVKMKMRKRKGRFGTWIDRKRVTDDELFEEYLNDDDEEEAELDTKMDEDSTPSRKRKRRNIYDCPSDAKKRLKSQFMYDRDLPLMSTIDPSTLNRIGKQAQVIRFGSMLSKKAYDNMTNMRAKHASQVQQQIKHQQQLHQQQQQQQQQLQKKAVSSTPQPDVKKEVVEKAPSVQSV